ncbi:sigma factor-like helix-turn-helix DNA-binding protein [Ohessyouella blattaphilus]|uniref:ECF-type sigma factor n=1 Tax=Ohessyouella blattaphilus TaxID=2949333 RepID=A0ABT1ENM2_9FIRM|nr:sigma factor-like helix-turn-helix DNA-binding protein [Ohessyouella blattaphilus]MCP1110882.1 ECF-type sigma factor [Ohessyouella blattaphilus]MCR8564276.1 ECF-type sigma factor [Ohessyouella blattaphilus]
MKFNYAIERRKFEAEQTKKRSEYLAAGMTARQCDEMYEFDLELFRKERTFCRHNQYFPAGNFEDNDDAEKSPLLKKFQERLSTSDNYDELFDEELLQSIDDISLLKGLQALSTEQLGLLKLWAIDGFTHEEIALRLGITRSSVTDRITRIKNKIKKLY